MTNKIAELKLASMILLTKPHGNCEPYEILKEIENRCNQIVEYCYMAGYGDRVIENVFNGN